VLSNPQIPGARLVLVPGTEEAGTPFAAVFEEGSGPAWPLYLTELSRGKTGFSVTKIHMREDDGRNAGAVVVVRRGELSASAVAQGFAVARAALGFKCRETTDKTRGGSWVTSGELYVHIHIDVGDARRPTVIDRAFAGGESNDQQLRYLPIRLGVETLGRVVDGSSLAVAPLDPAARDLFSRQLLANAERLDSDPYAWVRERYLAAAAAAGDDRLLPLLASWAGASGATPSIQRTRTLAVRASAEIEARRDAARRVKLPNRITDCEATRARADCLGFDDDLDRVCDQQVPRMGCGHYCACCLEGLASKSDQCLVSSRAALQPSLSLPLASSSADRGWSPLEQPLLESASNDSPIRTAARLVRSRSCAARL
jgi:hypothetical protein